ncbi:NAD(P)H-hydrate dehydratase [Ectothiorhodospira marina]|uniref:Bifunctional NAD(P)H-hydrate repair enzyme n=1 Tax=Ectothiorhodospira marina TaxID=1396821 RepID=A0A1H7PSN9_9GAMM|nr:NAD(P)H-hydrate dehydratase [Ectothiorhodospira marina]SEL38901.1 NAD(P)H-hydrate epimerase [Ectothiorhodospira marina]
MLPTALYTAEQVRDMDRCAIQDHGIPGYTLMERAGAASLSVLRARWPVARVIAVVCGPGNNGGDGYVVARLAREAGLEVRLVAATDPRALQGDAARAWRDWQACSPSPRGGDARGLAGADVIVDGLLGTGLGRPVEGEMAQWVQAMNASPAPVLALDIPSGLNADTGAVMGCAVQAWATVTFIGLKQGLFTGAGPEHCGPVHYNDLDVPAAVRRVQVPAAWRWTGADLQSLGRRSRGAHKGHFGHVLVVGGDAGMPGAVRLAAEAAARVGAGLVSVATHPAHAALIPMARPELMCHGVEHPADLDALLDKASVVAVGPGLGQGPWGQALWQRVTQWQGPLVVDADALNLLATTPLRRDDWVLTPHPGEAGRLLGLDGAQVQGDRPTAAASLGQRYGGVCVLKGAGSLIQGPSGRQLCDAGNPGMASGGMGDVLTGVIAGLMAQGLPPASHWQDRALSDLEAAATLGVCVHAAAADRAAVGGERGLLATDLLACLRPTVNP